MISGATKAMMMWVGSGRVQACQSELWITDWLKLRLAAQRVEKEAQVTLS